MRKITIECGDCKDLHETRHYLQCKRFPAELKYDVPEDRFAMGIGPLRCQQCLDAEEGK